MTEQTDSHVEKPGPSEWRDPSSRKELVRAGIWIGLVALIALIVLAIQPILLIVGGIVFAAMIDGGVRLLGRVLPIARGIRLTIVLVGIFAFLAWMLYYSGSLLADQAVLLPAIVEAQIERLGEWGADLGLKVGVNDLKGFGSQIVGGVGRITSVLGTAIGAISSLIMIVVLGIFLSAEPRLYERGLAWMLPMGKRDEFYHTMDNMASALRRLLFGRVVGMAVEGVATWLMLQFYGVPAAALLGLLTGLLAFLPNIGAILSGLIMVLVGFSGGPQMGLYTIFVYLLVQTVDGYLIVPMIARRTVDLAPALVLAAQIIFGTLFGVLGLALADPIVAMVKVALETTSQTKRKKAAQEAA